ncbi:hypothetical protein BB560_004239 [Smittium megazygosporum]|uniref:AMP-dependent synthetase/ligase domain-containing protein n=1 Tax=Smittium megazygosporum TaxID=133381 RepID=A0A2T9Z9U8_9FUNG|nr:hypothetical protein BB560_004239 [Smittium megazygosporum]
MIFKSQFPTLEIPTTDFASFCFVEARREYSRKLNQKDFAICDGPSGKQLSLFDIERLSNSFASGLVNNFNFKDKDVVAVFSPNSIYYPIVVFGTLMCGGICSLANPTYTARELAHQLKDSNVKALATQSHLLNVAKEAIKISGLNIPDSRIILLDLEASPPAPITHISSFFSDKYYKRFKIYTPEECKERVAILFYSSGTTGLSKGVMLTHRNLISAILQNTIFNYNDGFFDKTQFLNRILAILPHYHSYGFVLSLMVGFCTATGVVTVPSFTIESFLSTIQKYRITFAHVVPPIIISILNYPKLPDYDLSSCRFFMTGAAPLGKDVLAKFKKTLPNAYMLTSYGMTEASPAVSLGFKSHPHDGSSGVLLSSMEAKVIDEDGNLLGYNQIGELCVRGPNIMKGYLNNEEATKNSIDSDGFMHTGDIAYVGKNENYYIVDRKKELIKYKGFQVPPAELESLLYLHDDVADSAVIGIYLEDKATEVPKAFITLSSRNKDLTKYQMDLKVRQIQEWVDSQVAPYKKLRGGIEVLEIIPKTASGKILRRDLRNMTNIKKKLEKTKNKL